MSPLNRLKLIRVGQINCAEVEFGDLTVLVGPQATGKSIFLQFLKLALDTGYVHDQLHKHGIEWERKVPAFLDVYLGEGMRGVWREGAEGSAVEVDGQQVDMAKWVAPRRRSPKATVFYIPAQRVLSLANGWPRSFQSFGSQDPFAVRDFSETFRLLMEQEFGPTAALFPKTNRLKREYRQLLSKHLFGGFGLRVQRYGAQKQLVLCREKQVEKQEAEEEKQQEEKQLEPTIPFMAWSAGQREFVPLLMGLYWLMPSAKVKRRGDLSWVIIEEPEMGLHPNAISAVMLLVLELLWREYRVCLSTHSPHVLDVVWAIRTIQQYKADSGRLLEIFDVRRTGPMREVANAVVAKKFKVYYFDRPGEGRPCEAREISKLDPGSEDSVVAGWGGLTEFSGRVNEIVAEIVNQRPGPHGEEKVEPADPHPADPGDVAAEAQLPNLRA